MTSHPFENDDGRTVECGDEDGLCPDCFAVESAKWARYFGLTSNMTRQQERNALEQFRPLSCPANGEG